MTDWVFEFSTTCPKTVSLSKCRAHPETRLRYPIHCRYLSRKVKRQRSDRIVFYLVELFCLAQYRPGLQCSSKVVGPRRTWVNSPRSHELMYFSRVLNTNSAGVINNNYNDNLFAHSARASGSHTRVRSDNACSSA